MTSGEGNTVIRRKTRASRDEYQTRAMSPAKALRLALAQASDTLFNLPMVVAAVEQVELSQTTLAPELSGGGLLVLLDGPNGACGAVRIDDALLAALIEIQTTGRVSGRSSTGRAVTRTDSAIAAPLIDAALAGAEEKLAEETNTPPKPAHWIEGYRFGVMIEDARSMTLALHAPAFHVFRIMVEVGDAAHPGAITFLLPVIETAPPPAESAQGGAAPRTLEQNTMAAPVSLDAVLARVTLPLDQLFRLQPGTRLPFTMEHPMQIRLEASQKHVVAFAQLGQLNGARAVRFIPAGTDTAQNPAIGGSTGHDTMNTYNALSETTGKRVPDTQPVSEISVLSASPAPLSLDG